MNKTLVIIMTAIIAVGIFFLSTPAEEKVVDSKAAYETVYGWAYGEGFMLEALVRQWESPELQGQVFTILDGKEFWSANDEFRWYLKRAEGAHEALQDGKEAYIAYYKQWKQNPYR